jgi:outer membrane protein assembly factor BamB
MISRRREEYERVGLRGGCLFYSLLMLCAVFAGSVFGASDNSALPEAFKAEDLLWEIRLGTHQYTIPVIENGRIFLGINDRNLRHPVLKKTGGGLVMCLEEGSGEMVWQLPIPRYMEGTKAPFHFNHWECGVCSRPALEGGRMYIVGSRGEVLCLDIEGQADGNHDPFKEEAEYIGVPEGSDYQLAESDGDIIWRYDMIEELSVVPHDMCGSTPLLLGDYLYVCTSNGMDDTHKDVANPSAPSLIVLDKKMGRLAAVDGELIGERMFHGHWSSPVGAEIDGRDVIFFGGGDGVLYAFEAFKPSKSREVEKLKKIWEYDCNPSDYRKRDGKRLTYSSWNRNSPDGPSEIIATPVVYNDRIYVAIGQSPIHGVGKGILSCVDAKTGKKVWESREVGRSLSNVVISDGLLYIADFSGRLHCFDADRGELYWQHELEAGVWSASPIVVEGKVYISTEKNILWVLKAGREKKVVSRSRLKSMAITPTFKDGVFYLPTQKRLFALKIESVPSLASDQ